MRRFNHGPETQAPAPEPRPKWWLKGQRKPGTPPRSAPKTIEPVASAPPPPTQPPTPLDPRPGNLEVAVEFQALKTLRDKMDTHRDKMAITAQLYVLRPNRKEPSQRLCEEFIDRRFDDHAWTWNQWHAALFARAWLDGNMRGWSLVDLWRNWITRKRRRSWNTWRDQPETPCGADTPSSSRGHAG